MQPAATIDPFVAVEQAQRTAVADERLRFAHDVIARQSRQMGRLLDDLLDVGRVMQGRIALKKSPVDLAALSRDVVALARTSGGPEARVQIVLRAEAPGARLLHPPGGRAQVAGVELAPVHRLLRRGDCEASRARDHAVGDAKQRLLAPRPVARRRPRPEVLREAGGGAEQTAGRGRRGLCS